jgi:hypothetical protein
MRKQVNWAYWIAGQAGVIPVALGMPGVAKTESARALARAAGRLFLPVMLDQILPEDLGGYPVVRELRAASGGEPALECMRRVIDEKFMAARLEPSVMLFDELTNAGHAQQAAALQIMAEGIEGCWIFAAANPPEQAAAGVELTPPMVNRLCVLPWEIDRDAIMDGWRAGLEFPAPDVPLLAEGWRSHLASWGSLMCAFHTSFPDVLDAFPRDPTMTSQPFPSPRSWTHVVKLCAAAESVEAGPSVRAKLVHGCVGQAAATQFLTWLSMQDLPDPEELLCNPKRLKLPKRGDLALAIVSSVLTRVERNSTPDRWEAGRDFLGVVFEQAQEIAVAAHGKLWKSKPDNYLPKVRRDGVYTQLNQLVMGGAS